MSDRQIRAAASCGATCMRDLARELGVGTCCGKCLPEARATLSAALTTQQPVVSASPQLATA